MKSFVARTGIAMCSSWGRAAHESGRQICGASAMQSGVTLDPKSSSVP